MIFFCFDLYEKFKIVCSECFFLWFINQHFSLHHPVKILQMRYKIVLK
jgi:hypothetical protein